MTAFLVLSVGCSDPTGYSAPAPISCPADRAPCNGACVNLLTDGQNCGACGRGCPAGSGCAGGVCVGGCAAPRQTCGGTCTDTSSDPRNCGSCGVACGARQACIGGTCVCACQRGYTCNATGTACLLDRNSLWVVTVVSGTVSARDPAGDLWDPDGAPEPRVCLAINGATLCTTPTTTTFTPVWGNGFPATAASNLLAGIQSSYVDVDDVFNDDICASGPIRFTEANFNGAPVTFRCDPTGSFTLSLSPAP